MKSGPARRKSDANGQIGLNLMALPPQNPSHESGWADSNRRPSDPQSDALTKLRYSP